MASRVHHIPLVKQAEPRLEEAVLLLGSSKAGGLRMQYRAVEKLKRRTVEWGAVAKQPSFGERLGVTSWTAMWLLYPQGRAGAGSSFVRKSKTRRMGLNMARSLCPA